MSEEATIERRVKQDMQIKQILDKIADVKEDIAHVHNDVRKTNGRVQKLESWRSFISGGLVILSMIVVPILIFIITKWPGG